MVTFSKGVTPFLWMLLIWLAMTAGDLPSLLLGIPFSVLAAALYLWLPPALTHSPQQYRPWHQLLTLFRFVPWFIAQSAAGAIRVVGFVFSTRHSIPQTQCCFQTRLRDTLAQRVLLYCINLLPGTLVIHHQHNQYELHLLPPAQQQLNDLTHLETAIAAMLGLSDDTMIGRQA